MPLLHLYYKDVHTNLTNHIFVTTKTNIYSDCLIYIKQQTILKVKLTYHLQILEYESRLTWCVHVRRPFHQSHVMLPSKKLSGHFVDSPGWHQNLDKSFLVVLCLAQFLCYTTGHHSRYNLRYINSVVWWAVLAIPHLAMLQTHEKMHVRPYTTCTIKTWNKSKDTS